MLWLVLVLVAGPAMPAYAAPSSQASFEARSAVFEASRRQDLPGAGIPSPLWSYRSLRAQASGPAAHVVIMVDKSGSTRQGADLTIQLRGYASALERPEVGDSLARAGTELSVIVWSGVDEHLLLIDRAPVGDRGTSRWLAAAVRGLPLAAGGLTDLAAAIGYAVSHIEGVAERAACAVIIVATDQFAAAGYVVADRQEGVRDAHVARARAARLGITVHGLGLEDAAVAKYLRDHVATPDGEVAFVASDDEFADEASRLLAADFCRALIAGTPLERARERVW